MEMATVVYGGLAVQAETMILYPVDLVKTRMQLRVNRSVGEIIRDTYRMNEQHPNTRSFYRGMWAPFWSGIPKVGSRVIGFQCFKRIIVGEIKKPSFLRVATCGAGAGIVEASLITTPVETIK